VVSRSNELITRQLLEGARDGLRRHGADEEALTVVWVPGAFELPLVARRLGGSGAFDAVVCLGPVIRGATPHSITRRTRQQRVSLAPDRTLACR
jgi:6,7-dimethyl-8-ribityllumazine synthase